MGTSKSADAQTCMSVPMTLALVVALCCLLLLCVVVVLNPSLIRYNNKSYVNAKPPLNTIPWVVDLERCANESNRNSHDDGRAFCDYLDYRTRCALDVLRVVDDLAPTLLAFAQQNSHEHTVLLATVAFDEAEPSLCSHRDAACRNGHVSDLARAWRQNIRQVLPVTPMIICLGEYTANTWRQLGEECILDTFLTRVFVNQSVLYQAANGKYLYTLALLRLGYHVLFSDVDVAFAQSPWDAMRADSGAEWFSLSDLWPSHPEQSDFYRYWQRPYQARIEAPATELPRAGALYGKKRIYGTLWPEYAASTGFFMVRATPLAEQLTGMLFCVLEQNTTVWEQFAFNWMVDSFVRMGMKFDLLDMQRFSNAAVYNWFWRPCQYACQPRVLVHAGYTHGSDEKIALLEEAVSEWRVPPRNLTMCKSVLPATCRPRD